MQRGTCEKLAKDYDARGVTFMRVIIEIDGGKLGVNGTLHSRSTLIAFKGARELGRSQWLTTEPEVGRFLEDMLAKAGSK